MRDTQGRESTLKDNLRMGAGVTENMNQILAMTFLADIAHARRDPSGIKTELPGTRSTKNIEEFIGFCSGAHKPVLSLTVGRCECSDGEIAAQSIRHSVEYETPIECYGAQPKNGIFQTSH
jgi:hypothetical protein